MPVRSYLIRSAVLVGLVTPAAAAIACRCVPRSAVAYAKAADAIIVAEVAAVEDGLLGRTYRLQADRSWKRRIAGPLVVDTGRTNCRSELSVGGRYLLYLERAEGGYRTDNCSGNRPMAQAAAAVAGLGRPL